jgi:hypothetical protein
VVEPQNKLLFSLFAVEASHYNLTSMILQLRAGDPGPYTPSAKFAVIVPLYHIYGTVFFIFMPRMSFSPTNCGLTKTPDPVMTSFLPCDCSYSS